MLQGLSIALTQVEARSNEIRQIVQFLYRTKDITEKVCKNVMNLMEIIKNLILIDNYQTYQIKWNQKGVVLYVAL